MRYFFSYTVQCIVYLLQITLQRSVVGSVVSSVELSVYSMTFLLRVVRGQAVRVVQVTLHLYSSYHNTSTAVTKQPVQ